MKVTVYSTAPYEQPFFEENENLQFSLRKEKLSLDSVKHAEGAEAILIFTRDSASAEVLAALKEKGVKYLATRTMGLDHIDLESARKLGIKVAHVPHYSPHSVAEHGIALMLALNRKITLAYEKVKSHDFRLEGLVGFDMHQKKVGILGAGEIGEVTAKILHGFGCEILIYDLKEDKNLKEKYGVQYVSIEDLCKNCDVITIHAPLTDATQHLVNKEKIDWMKEGVMLINTARGAICKTEDLIEGIKRGKIGYLGLDVYEHEQNIFFENHTDTGIQDPMMLELLTFNNVIITSHQAFLTKEALTGSMETSLESLKAWGAGETPENELE